MNYYFDFKDGVRRRDRFGSPFAIDSEAIEHGKLLAKSERTERPDGDRDLVLSVINESGAEIYSEWIYPTSKQTTAKFKVGP